MIYDEINVDYTLWGCWSDPEWVLSDGNFVSILSDGEEFKYLISLKNNCKHFPPSDFDLASDFGLVTP